MDIRCRLHGITFVWDRDTARTNPVTHDGVTFEQAAEAFFDPFLKVVDASRQGEMREAIIGMDNGWHLFFVVHIDQDDDTIRLISARKATRKERASYEA